MTYSPELFKEIDTSEDRQLSEEEFESYFRQNNKTKIVQELWKNLDSNKNKKIAFVEWKTWSEEVLALESLDIIFAGSKVP